MANQKKGGVLVKSYKYDALQEKDNIIRQLKEKLEKKGLRSLIGERFSTLEELKERIEFLAGKRVTTIVESESERPEGTDFMIDFEYEEWDIHTIFYLKDNGGKYYITEV